MSLPKKEESKLARSASGVLIEPLHPHGPPSTSGTARGEATSTSIKKKLSSDILVTLGGRKTSVDTLAPILCVVDFVPTNYVYSAFQPFTRVTPTPTSDFQNMFEF